MPNLCTILGKDFKIIKNLKLHFFERKCTAAPTFFGQELLSNEQKGSWFQRYVAKHAFIQDHRSLGGGGLLPLPGPMSVCSCPCSLC